MNHRNAFFLYPSSAPFHLIESNDNDKEGKTDDISQRNGKPGDVIRAQEEEVWNE